MNWIYLKKEITSVDQFPNDIMGFVYRIIHTPSKKEYIGKKFLVFTQKRKLAKKDLKLYEGQPGRKPKFKIVSKVLPIESTKSSTDPASPDTELNALITPFHTALINPANCPKS